MDPNAFGGVLERSEVRVTRGGQSICGGLLDEDSDSPAASRNEAVVAGRIGDVDVGVPTSLVERGAEGVEDVEELEAAVLA